MEVVMTGVRKATRDDRATVADVLASAFSEDPLWLWMTGATPSVESRIRPYFASIAKINLAKPDHEIFVNEPGDGAAIWFGIDRWKVSVGDLVRSTSAAIRTFRLRGPRALRALSAMEKAHPREPHYYLEYLGTRSDRQGKGVGTEMMAPMLERCDTEGLPAYLESSQGAVPFYARHGFTSRGHIVFPAGCPPLLPMWREPR
jgi:GNAT superfamily N-acetyltransferase